MSNQIPEIAFLDAGALFSWRRLSLMAGVSAIGFKTVCAELGVGYCF